MTIMCSIPSSSSRKFTTTSPRSCERTSASSLPLSPKITWADVTRLPYRFILRDFTYSETQIKKQSQDLEVAETTERELWTELLRLARTNFSEAFQVWVHLKVVRLFVESVLRYGLPAEYVGLVVKARIKQSHSS